MNREKPANRDAPCGHHNTRDYKAAAITLWGDAGAFVHDCYDHWRPLLPELPERIPIVIGLSAYGRCLGLTRAGDPYLDGPRISIASQPQYLQGANDVRDVMLHEMLHVWLYVTGREMSHQSDDWYAAINRLSPAVLGRDLNVKRGSDRRSVRVKLDDGRSKVTKVRVDDATPHADVARWPQAFRPLDRDRGEPIRCPTY